MNVDIILQLTPTSLKLLNRKNGKTIYGISALLKIVSTVLQFRLRNLTKKKKKKKNPNTKVYPKKDIMFIT